MMLRIKQSLQSQAAKSFLTQTRNLSATSINMHQNFARNFSLFQSVGSSQNNRQHIHQDREPQNKEQQQQRNYLDVLQNIQKYQTSIQNKTQEGMTLSKTIANQVEPNKYQNQQMYEIFIQKMDALYKSEMRYKRKLNKKLSHQKLSNLYSQSPLKEILRTYHEMTSRGFNSELVSKTLKNLDAAIRGRGFDGKVMMDYSQTELEESWRMQKLVEDIMFGLRGDQYFNPYHLGQTSNLLADINYKNSQLFPLFFEKINALINERETGQKENPELTFNQAMYGGFKNFLPRHYVFKGFENSQDFNSHLKILLNWEDQRTLNARKKKAPKELDQEVAELQAAMKEVIDASLEVKELQKDLQATIENVRTQYFKMLEASDKHAFLQENEYIKYDLLELQEMLVTAGYLSPDEALQHLANEPFEKRMDRAAHVFYDYVVNYAPEVMSPHYEDFYQAAMENLQNNSLDSKKEVSVDLNENHNLINLASLSQILLGLRRQALLFRKDVSRKDYLNDFYHQFVEPDDYMQFLKTYTMQQRKIVEEKNVKMERVYLRPWWTFKTQTDKLIPYMKELVEKDSNSIENQIQGLLAFAASGHDVPDIRKQLVANSLRLAERAKFSEETIKGGLMGLALSSTQDENTRLLARKLGEQLQPDKYEFSQQIDILWSMCALQLYDLPQFKQMLKAFEIFKFERINNEIKYEEFNKLIDIMNALKIETSGKQKIKNKSLEDAYVSRQHLKMTYKEGSNLFDPFKKRVVTALAQGLGSSSISHELIMEEEFLNQTLSDKWVMNPTKYPYSPDLLMGYKGQKIAMFVLTEQDATRDTYEPNGAVRFRMRLLENSQPGEIKAVAVAVNNVVSYDIEKMKMNINTSFNFQKLLEKRIEGADKLQDQHDFTQLTEFGYGLVKDSLKFQETQPRIDQVQKLDSFIKKLCQIFQMKQQADLKIDKTQRNTGYDQVRFQLMLASFMYDGLSKETQKFVNSHLPENKSLRSLLLETASSIKTQNENKQDLPEGLDDSWLGTRLDVELPQSLDATQKVQKAIEPEMINQRFMWVQSYFHYKDWQKKQESVYDGFNLLQIPPHKDHHKLFFDQDSFHRRIPKGIFPFPNHKREVLRPVTQYAEFDIDRSKNNDELALFEKEPFKLMVLKELNKGKKMQKITPEISMITNLQNIKQGLKSDYSDRELLNTILLNLDFTDQLIEEHLRTQKNQVGNEALTFVPRDASAYREFVLATYDSKDRQDPFTHFYLREAAIKQEQFDQVEKMHQDMEEERYDMHLEDEKYWKDRTEKMEAKIDKVLLEYEMKNEDLYQLGTALPNVVNIQFDVKSLIKSEFIYEMEPELIDKGISDEEYLQFSRRRAESKLIKMKILYKIQKSAELSQNESKYLKAWINDITVNQDRNILNLRDSLLPSEPTRLSLNDIDAKNFYTLNTISKVELDRIEHGNFALNDIILEISHFLDEDVVKKVESEMLSERLRNDWGISKDFKVVESRNKEISMVLNELEEVAYRAAGEFTEKDLEYIKAMVSISRNKDIFDKTFYENDMKSLESFVKDVNKFDDRVDLLEKWIRRKENEIKERVVLPPANLRKSDPELQAQYDKPLKQAREKLVAKILAQDEYGNPINKQYNDLSTRELHVICENLAVRLYMFNYEYPEFLPQTVKAIIEHPNTLKSDKDLLENYCKIFELDWRGDQSYENKQHLLFQTPIYPHGTNIKSYGVLDNEALQNKMRRACASYVEPLVKQLLSHQN